MRRARMTYRDLDAWQRAMDLTVAVYGLTTRYPRHELYGLTSQTRRCASSIAANLAEGKMRRGDAEFCRFLYIAAGSLAELETFLELAERLGYITDDELAPVSSLADEVGKLVYGLISVVRSALDE